MATDNRYVICPLCARNRKMIVAGKGTARFDQLDPKTSPFMDFRDMSGGKAKGFPRLTTMTVKEIIDNPEYRGILLQMKRQAQKILDLLKDLPED